MNSLPIVVLVVIGVLTYPLSSNEYQETKVSCNNQDQIVYKNTKMFTTTWLSANGESFTKLPDYCKELQ